MPVLTVTPLLSPPLLHFCPTETLIGILIISSGDLALFLLGETCARVNLGEERGGGPAREMGPDLALET